MFVDIIKVTDSLDAASDHIGRRYSDMKDFNQIYEELKLFAGSIYSTNIIELLDDPIFLNQLHQSFVTQ